MLLLPFCCGLHVRTKLCEVMRMALRRTWGEMGFCVNSPGAVWPDITHCSMYTAISRCTISDLSFAGAASHGSNTLQADAEDWHCSRTDFTNWQLQQAGGNRRGS